LLTALACLRPPSPFPTRRSSDLAWYPTRLILDPFDSSPRLDIDAEEETPPPQDPQPAHLPQAHRPEPRGQVRTQPVGTAPHGVPDLPHGTRPRSEERRVGTLLVAPFAAELS